jgi:hypothetical chaperone protein
MNCGLDFGTSNSAIGITAGADVQLVEVEPGRRVIPTTIFFDYEDGSNTFGTPAIDKFLAGRNGRVLWSIKSVLGSALMTERTLVRERMMSFGDIIGLILRNLKEHAERAAGTELERVVLGRPVRFHDRDDAADKEAERILRDSASRVGFREIAFQFEPIAAALDYERRLERETMALVVDVGGGTSDFCVIRLDPRKTRSGSDRRTDILSVGGVHIGGTDFDRMLSTETVMPELGLGTSYTDSNGNVMPFPRWVFYDLATWLRINFIYSTNMLHGIFDIFRSARSLDPRTQRLERVLTKHLGHRLARRVEATKIALSDAATAPLALDLIANDLALQLTRTQLDDAIDELLLKIDDTVSRVIADSGVGANDIDVVFFTGGGASIPALRRRISSLLPNARPAESDHFGGIARGLTLEAARRWT